MHVKVQTQAQLRTHDLVLRGIFFVLGGVFRPRVRLQKASHDFCSRVGQERAQNDGYYCT